MLEHLRHRGPDKQGYYQADDDSCVIGNTRLSIVDPFCDFKIPMVSQSGNYILTFNGEIYNYKELALQLSAKDVSFRTHSDTEVLLEGLALYGSTFIDKLDGFWSYALYEKNSRKLILSRDLLGERHIFYAVHKGELVFASEINAILAVIPELKELEFESVVSAFRYRAPAPGHTLIKGIKRLKPGYILEVCNKKITIKRKQRFQLNEVRESFQNVTDEKDIFDRYCHELSIACASRLPKEVEYLTSLSGGIDSAIVNIFNSLAGNTKFKTLYGLSTDSPPQIGSDLDEYEASNFTSKALNTHHIKFDMLDHRASAYYRKQCANSFDGVFCEGTAAFNQLANQVVQHNGKVLILSDGPDELLCGYSVDNQLLKNIKKFNRNKIAKLINNYRFKSRAGRLKLSIKQRNKLLNWSYYNEQPFSFRPIHGGTDDYTLTNIFTFDDAFNSYGYYGSIPGVYGDIVKELTVSQKMALSYASHSLPDYFNVRSDRGVSAESVETRLPLQSKRLVEFMIASPDKARFGERNISKDVLRAIVNRFVGPQVAYRGKYGFATPAWQNTRIEKEMEMTSYINESSVFTDYPFLENSRKYFLNKNNVRIKWFAYCLAITYETLKSGDFMHEAQTA